MQAQDQHKFEDIKSRCSAIYYHNATMFFYMRDIVLIHIPYKFDGNTSNTFFLKCAHKLKIHKVKGIKSPCSASYGHNATMF